MKHISMWLAVFVTAALLLLSLNIEHNANHDRKVALVQCMLIRDNAIHFNQLLDKIIQRV